MEISSDFRKILIVVFFAILPSVAVAQPVLGQPGSTTNIHANDHAVSVNAQQYPSLMSVIHQMRLSAQTYGAKLLSVNVKLGATAMNAPASSSSPRTMSLAAASGGSFTVSATERVGRQNVTVTKSARTCAAAGKAVEKEFQTLLADSAGY